MGDLDVRPATRTDAEAIVDFQIRLAAESEGLVLDRGTVKRGVHAVFEEPAKGEYWVAERDGQIVGSMLVTPEWSDWRAATVLWIHSLYVVPEARRQGVFRRMEAAVREMVRNSPDLAGIRMIIDKGNRVSQQTATALGYTCEHYDTCEWLKDR